MTIYSTDADGNITIEFDSRWKHPQDLGIDPDSPLGRELIAMYWERRHRNEDG